MLVRQFAILFIIVISLVQTTGLAGQNLIPPKELEESELRRALEALIQSDPERAPAAQKALDALNQPETSPQGRQVRGRRERGARRIVNGLATSELPAVGALLKGNSPGTAGIQCTGTLVGCDKFLTAAHCIADNPEPSSYFVFFQNFGFFKVRKIAWQPRKYKFPHADLAMLSLDRTVEGASPVALNLDLSTPRGTLATIAGFGRTGGNQLDYGIKREGSARIEDCSFTEMNDKLICWNYYAEINTPFRDSNTCHADSGGGVFVLDRDGQRTIQRLIGVVSGGLKDTCLKGDHSFNTDVHGWKQWLQKAGEGRISSQVCGYDATQSMKLLSQNVSLSEKAPGQEISLEVSDTVATLRIAMNGEDNGEHANDFDMVLFQKQSGELRPVCEQKETGQFAFCEVRRPKGSFLIKVSRKRGEGAAQITVSQLSK